MTLELSLGSLAIGGIKKPAGETIDNPSEIGSGLKIWLDGSDASTVTLFPSTLNVDKWTGKSSQAVLHNYNNVAYVVYDEAGKRLDFANSSSFLVNDLGIDLGFSGKKSITIGLTANPPTPSGSRPDTAYCLTEGVVDDFCWVGVFDPGSPTYEFIFDTDVIYAGTPTPGTPQSIVCRYKNVSPGVAEYHIWVDGTKTGPIAGSATGSFPSGQYSVVGRKYWSPVGTWKKYIHQVCAYDNALSDEDVAKLITFLDSKK